MLPVHGDEFYFLSRIYEHQRGELHEFFQTFHVHLFGWLTKISGTEVNQIVAAREGMAVLAVVSGGLLYLIARTYFTIVTSVAVVVAYFSFAEVAEYGVSFRCDTLLLPLLLAAILFLRAENNKHVAQVAAGALIGFGVILTLKALLFLPMLLVYGWVNNRVSAARTVGAIAGSSAITLVLLAAFHASVVSAPSEPSPLLDFAGTYGNFLLGINIPRNIFFLKESLRTTTISWILLIAGASVIVRKIRSGVGSNKFSSNECSLLILGSSLLPILFYRNSFPYFYVLMLAPASLLIGYIVEALTHTTPKLSFFLASLCIMVFGCQLILSWQEVLHHDDAKLITQAETLTTIHELFPKPVAYLDANSEVSSFPKAGFFMSTHWLEKYVASGQPLVKEIVMRKKPQFLLANLECLDLSRKYEDAVTPAGYQLQKEDWDYLRQNFRPYKNGIYLAN